VPNIDSAKKRVKQDEVRKERNKAYKSRFKNSIKKVLLAIDKKAEKEENR